MKLAAYSTASSSFSSYRLDLLFWWTVVCVVVTSAQSAAVAAAATPPINDRCVNATPVVIGSSVIGDLTLATPDNLDVTYACNAAEEAHFTQARLNLPGVWYTFQGTGRRVSIVNLVNIPTPFWQVLVYRGDTCDKNVLQCVTRFTVSWQSAPFTFNTELGATYQMLVYGPLDEGPNNVNAFNLSTVSLPPTFDDNDVCTRATPIVVDGAIINGTTSFATSDENQVNDNCVGDAVDYKFPGVWYSFVGTGGKVTVKLLSTTRSDLSIFKGACGTLQCVAGSGSAAQVTFYTDMGATHYLMLRGLFAIDRTYSVQLVSVPPNDAPLNDVCTQATPTIIGAPIAGSLVNAAFQTNRVASCSDRSPGLWFRFPGTGGRVTVVSNQCEESALRNVSTVHVYKGTGSCGALQCVASLSVIPCDAAPFSFTTEPASVATVYYVLIQNRGFQHVFNMSLIAASVVNDNDVCSNAKVIAVGESIRRNNITLATTDEKDVSIDCSCGNVTNQFARGLWFSFVGTGNRIWADVCGGSGSVLRTKAAVYQGTCSSNSPSVLQCVAGHADPCAESNPQKLTFGTDLGTTYHLLVQNQPNRRQNASLTSLFDVSISNVVSHPSNDVCANATMVNVGSTITGSQEFATSDEHEVSTVCAKDFTSGFTVFPGVWYRFAGTGANVKVTSVCGNGFSATDIHIYKGTCGPNTLQCVTGFVNQCYNVPVLNTFNFTAETGTAYFILVRRLPFEDASQKFQVALESIAQTPVAIPPIVPATAQQCLVGSPPAPSTLSPVVVAPPMASPPKVSPTAPLGSPTVVIPPVSTPVLGPPSIGPASGPVTLTPVVVSPVVAPAARPTPATTKAPIATLAPLASPPKVSPTALDPSPVAAFPSAPVIGTPMAIPLPSGPAPVAGQPIPIISPAASITTSPQVPSIPSPTTTPLPLPRSPPVRPPSLGRCRRLGCRIRRIFKNLFG